MGRRSAGDNDQQLNVADLLRAATNDRQPRRARRHGDSSLATVRDDPQLSEVALPSEQVGGTSAIPEEIQQQAGDLATPPADGIGPDRRQGQVTEPADELATSPPEDVSAAKDSDQVSELAIDPVSPLPDGFRLDPRQGQVTEPADELATSLPGDVSAAKGSDQVSELAIDPVSPLPDGVRLDPRQRQVTEPADALATSLPEDMGAAKDSDQVSELASDLPMSARDGLSAGQQSDQTVAQEREQRVETTGAPAPEVLDADIAAKNADSQLSSAFAFLSAPDPAEHRIVPTATPLSSVGPAVDLDTAEVPAVDDRDASAESSSSTAYAEPAEVEAMPNMAMRTPTETEPRPQAQSDLVDHSAATSWLLAIGEVVLAIVIGAGLAYVFRLLWDIYPYVAAVIAPLVICGVIGVVGLARKRMRQGAIPLSLLLVILFITGLLVVLPAAWVMTTR